MGFRRLYRGFAGVGEGAGLSLIRAELPRLSTSDMA